MAAHNKDHAKPGTTPPITWAGRSTSYQLSPRDTLREALPQKPAGEDANVAAEVTKEEEGHARETTKNKGKDILVIRENQLTQPPHNKSSSNSAKEPKQPAKESTKEGGKTNKVASQLSESKGETLKRNGKEPLVQPPLQGEDNIEVDEGEEGEEVSSSQQNRPSTSAMRSAWETEAIGNPIGRDI
ncbi:hypothetical protein OIU77_022132 [Salix suchowensis]|uniref:Uncharacterized protein n=1 Tax=Salix suchowensis TaxID=1278906 RepID=A0ABQ8ZGU5_9ROSI|nr:hypothetical protein OIU77_022132 [Salix suchowensis]